MYFLFILLFFSSISPNPAQTINSRSFCSISVKYITLYHYIYITYYTKYLGSLLSLLFMGVTAQ